MVPAGVKRALLPLQRVLASLLVQRSPQKLNTLYSQLFLSATNLVSLKRGGLNSAGKRRICPYAFTLRKVAHKSWLRRGLELRGALQCVGASFFDSGTNHNCCCGHKRQVAFAAADNNFAGVCALELSTASRNAHGTTACS